MSKVLDDELLAGVFAAETHLRPPRHARAVEATDYSAACKEVTHACQLWGGAADLLVPVASGRADPSYRRLLRHAEVDAVGGDQAGCLAEHLPGVVASSLRRAPALLTLAGADREGLRDIHVCAPPPDDPWHLAYLAVLGTLPGRPDPAQLNSLLLRPDLTFDDVITICRLSPIRPGVEDLQARLRFGHPSPIGFSLHGLTGHPAAAGHSGVDDWLADPSAVAQRSGRTTVVVYTPSSVADLCLLWNLRAMHGWPSGLPLGVPAVGTDVAALDTVAQLVDGLIQADLPKPVSVLLSSASLPVAVLEEIAQRLTTTDREVIAVPPDLLLHPASPPSRPSFITATVERGHALVPTRTEADRRLLASFEQTPIKPAVLLTVRVPTHVVPPSVTLRAGDGWLGVPRFTGGGCTVEAPTDELVSVRWPSLWTATQAIARDRDVVAEPSPSGRTASALLRTIGTIDDIRWLTHRPLLELLYAKASASGTSYYKRRTTEQAAIVAEATTDPEASLARLMEAIQHVSGAQAGEGHSIVFSELVEVLGREAAKIWLDWAESHRLLIRGTTVTCPYCQHSSWRLLAELAPPISCVGCGRPHDRPFDDTSMSFSFRLGEPLRRTIENDSLYHLLVMRAIVDLLAHSHTPLVGAHPGVNLLHGGYQREADVLLLLADGTFVPVEVKARSSGLRQKDLDRLDTIAEWLGSELVVVACGDDDQHLDPVFAAAPRVDPLPVRRLLTADDWLDPYPVVTLGGRLPGPAVGADRRPRERTAEDHDQQFARTLATYGPLTQAPDPVARILGPR